MTSTLTLRTETTGVRPEFEYVPRHDRDCSTAPAEMFQRRGRQINERATEVMELSWEDARDGQRRFLESMWRDAKGPVLSMNYTKLGDVDANAIEVCFVENSLVIDRNEGIGHRMRVTLEEVH